MYTKELNSMFDRDDTRAKVIAIISEALNVDGQEIQEEQSLEDIGADSLDRLEMIMKFEETFGIDISDDQEARITTIGQAVDAIHTLRTK